MTDPRAAYLHTSVSTIVEPEAAAVTRAARNLTTHPIPDSALAEAFNDELRSVYHALHKARKRRDKTGLLFVKRAFDEEARLMRDELMTLLDVRRVARERVRGRR